MITADKVIALARGGVDPEGGFNANQVGDSESAMPMVKSLAPVQPMFALGKSSEANLIGVIPSLEAVVHLAITLSTQDFTVYEGLRSLAQQRINIQKGVSQTLDSMHLRQSDGFGHAVDLVPWIDGHPVWDWDGCYKIALAMDLAATRLNCAQHIRWGGAWDKTLADFGGNESAYKDQTVLYAARHAGKDFLDGPHFEWKM
jgi:peptidoglycan L-alanyl-D-glutamate endopeptidase CwlK